MYQDVGCELHRLEKLFAASLSGKCEPEGLFQILLSPDQFKGEIPRIGERLIQKLSTFESEDCGVPYLQFHLRAIIWLMDEIICLTPSSLIPPGYADLQNLLDFIERHFSDFIDHDDAAAIRRTATARAECAESLTQREHKFSEPEVDPNVFEIAFYPLPGFTSDKAEKGVTYDRLGFTELLKSPDQNSRVFRPKGNGGKYRVAGTVSKPAHVNW